MSLLPVFMLVFVLYAAPLAFGIGLILWLTKVKLEANELGSFFISIAVWFALTAVMGRGKSLANLAFEPIILSIFMLVLFVARCGMKAHGARSSRGQVAATLLASMAFAAGVYFFTPALPE